MTVGEFNFLNEDLLDKFTELWTEFEKENYIRPQTVLRAEDAHQFLAFLKKKVEENRERTCDNCVNRPDPPNIFDPEPWPVCKYYPNCIINCMDHWKFKKEE